MKTTLIFVIVCTAILMVYYKAWGGECRTIILDNCHEADVSDGVYCYKLICDDPNQVTAYKASDGKLFETRGEMEEYEAELIRESKVEDIKALYYQTRNREHYFSFATLIVDRWPEIKAIMEGQEKP